MTRTEKFYMHLDNLNSAIAFFKNECNSGIRDVNDIDWIISKAEYREDIDEVVFYCTEKKREVGLDE